MSTTPDDNDDFIARYTRLMLSVWSDPEAERRLLVDPRAEALAAGLPVRPGAAVTVDRGQPDGMFTRETLVGDWSAGPEQHVLHVPAAPMVDLDELDERELELLAGGASEAVTVVIVLCVVR